MQGKLFLFLQLLLMISYTRARWVRTPSGIDDVFNGQYQSDTTLVLWNTGLTEFIKELASNISNVVTLTLDYNQQMKSIAADAFEALGHLEALSIKNTKLESFPNIHPVRSTLKGIGIDSCSEITTIPPDAFLGMEKLTAVTITKTPIVKFPNLTGVTSMTKISFSETGIIDIPSEYLPESVTEFAMQKNTGSVNSVRLLQIMPNVTNLNLDKNELTRHIDEVLKDCQNLKTVYLRNNKLTHFPDFGNCLGKLTHIYLSNNNISVVPNDLAGKLTALQHLYLEQNSLVSYPSALLSGPSALLFLQLSNNAFKTDENGQPIRITFQILNTLTISSTGLDEFPDLTLAGNLTTVTLDGNVIQYVNKSAFGPGIKLRYLQITSNNLHTFPPIAGLEYLTTLNILRNNITKLSMADVNPDDVPITGLPLETLDLSYNQLGGNIDGSFWGILHNLKRLSLRHCKFKDVPPALNLVSSLEYLNLNDNPIQQFPAYILYGMPSLKSLSLQRNKLSTIPGAALKSLSSLNYLDLESNALTAIGNIMNQARPSFGLRLHYNPFNCNARTCWLKNDNVIESSNIEFSSSPCSTPSNLTGIAWVNVTRQDLQCHEYAGTLLDLTVPVDVYTTQEKQTRGSLYTGAAVDDHAMTLLRTALVSSTLPHCALECIAYGEKCGGFAYSDNVHQCWLMEP